jgi:DNA-directed RNA polymerase subunit M/transcription elongation factor TFIIS
MKDSDLCKICRYYLYLNEVQGNDVDEKSGESEPQLRRICRNCGYSEIMEGGLILELDLKEKTSEGYKILMNEFTKNDPTLPHVHNITCPNNDCESNTTDKESDIIYLKYDAVNMKFLYICNLCETKWRSKA